MSTRIAAVLCSFLAAAPFGCDRGSAETPVANSSNASTPTAAPTGPSAVAPAAAASSRPTPPPSAVSNRVTVGPITAEPGMVDFGLVDPKALVEVEVTLSNSSDAPIEIIASKPTCQCTTVDMTGKVIPARGSIQMPISMQTSAAVGIKQAAVSLLFRDIAQPMQVGLKAEVAYSVVARPLPYIDALEESRLSGTFDLESPNGQPFRVISVQGKSPTFVGFDPARDAPRARYTLGYDFRGLAASAVPKYMLIETDREDCPLVDIRVRHEATRLSPGFRFAEFRSMVGAIAPGESGGFTLEVEDMGPLRFDTVYAVSPDATAELLSQHSDGKNLLVSVNVTPRAGFTGLLQVPVTFVAGGRTAEQLVYAIVR